MPTIQVWVQLPEAELLDAGEEVGRLLDDHATTVGCAPLRHLLVALDDAITEALFEPREELEPSRARRVPRRSSAPAPAGRAASGGRGLHAGLTRPARLPPGAAR